MSYYGQRTASSASRAGTGGVSRLALIQARFQAQQMAEKEEKLIELLEQRQEESVRRMAYNNGNGNTTGSASYYVGSRPGRVRKMFEERRNNAGHSPVGWDKSYPLQPVKARNKYSGNYGNNNASVKRRSASQTRAQPMNRYEASYESGYSSSGAANGSSITLMGPRARSHHQLSRHHQPIHHPIHANQHSSGEDSSYASSSRSPSRTENPMTTMMMGKRLPDPKIDDDDYEEYDYDDEEDEYYGVVGARRRSQPQPQLPPQPPIGRKRLSRGHVEDDSSTAFRVLPTSRSEQQLFPPGPVAMGLSNNTLPRNAPMTERSVSQNRLNTRTFSRKSPSKEVIKARSPSPMRRSVHSSSAFKVIPDDQSDDEAVRLKMEMKKREDELLKRIKAQQQELENVKRQKTKVERELQQREVQLNRERLRSRERPGARSQQPAAVTKLNRSPSGLASAPSKPALTSTPSSSSSASSSANNNHHPSHQPPRGRRDRSPNKKPLLTRERLRTTVQLSNSSDDFFDAQPNLTAKAGSGTLSKNKSSGTKPPTTSTNTSRMGAAAGKTKNSPSPQTPSSPLRASPMRSSPMRSSPARQPPGAAATGSNNRRSIFASKPRDDLEQCPICGRNFAEDRIGKHKEICQKTARKKRKTFDMSKKRTTGTDAEAYNHPAIKKKTEAANKAAAKKSDWRKKREEFIQALRAAKEAQRHVAAGGKLSDLPPPPPMDTSDYVQCPHCQRKFNETAADRHIPKCKNIKSNKR